MNVTCVLISASVVLVALFITTYAPNLRTIHNRKRENARYADERRLAREDNQDSRLCAHDACLGDIYQLIRALDERTEKRFAGIKCEIQGHDFSQAGTFVATENEAMLAMGCKPRTCSVCGKFGWKAPKKSRKPAHKKGRA